MDAPAWIVKILSDNGLAGLVIFSLAVVIVVMYRQSVSVNNSRLSERDVLLTALGANTAAIKDNTKVTEERNVVTERLAAAIDKQGDVFSVFTANAKNQQDMLKDQTGAITKTIESLAETNRVNTGILKDIRDHQQRPAVM